MPHEKRYIVAIGNRVALGTVVELSPLGMLRLQAEAAASGRTVEDYLNHSYPNEDDFAGYFDHDTRSEERAANEILMCPGWDWDCSPIEDRELSREAMTEALKGEGWFQTAEARALVPAFVDAAYRLAGVEVRELFAKMSSLEGWETTSAAGDEQQPRHLFQNSECIYSARDLDHCWEMFTKDIGLTREEEEEHDPFVQIPDDRPVDMVCDEDPEETGWTKRETRAAGVWRWFATKLAREWAAEREGHVSGGG